MLRKLIKYDFKAMIRWYGIAFAACLVFALAVRFLGASATSLSSLRAGGFAPAILAFTLVILGTMLLSTVMPAVRFYQNLLKDEGYLMFTLPVTERQLYLSKMITAASLNVLSAIVIALSCFIGLYSTDAGPEIRLALEELEYLFNINFANVDLTVILIAFGALLLVSPLQTFATLFASMAIGQSFGKKPLASSVFAFFIVNGICNFAQSILFSFLSQAFGATAPFLQSQTLLLLTSAAFALVSSVVLSVIALRYLKNHRNLA